MTINNKRRFALTALAGASVLALGLTACSPGGGDADKGDGNADNGGGDSSRTMRVWAGSQTPITANFNPFAPTVLHATLGPIFEPLFYFNKTSDAPAEGVVGESYEFNEDGTELTIKIKPDQKWNDGEDLTAEDVAFTLSYAPNNGETSELIEAKATDDTTVVATYEAPQFSKEASLLGTWVLPEHVWSEVGDNYTDFANDENPVGSGPYKVESVTAESYMLVANENFRDEGVPAIKKVQYIAIDANQSAQDLLAAGELDWAGMFIPNPDSVTANGAIQWLNTPQDPTVIYTCSNAELGCTGPQTDVAVRQALNVAIDRSAINDKAFVGLTGKISPTYALLPRDEKWVADEANSYSPEESDAAEAGAILEAAGYAKGSDGFYAKDGQTVELTLTSVDGWTDYNDAGKLIAEQAAEAGIKITPSTVQWQEFSDSRQTGQFQLIIGGMNSTNVADPFQIYKDWLGGVAMDSTSPVGEELPTARWGISRYNNPKVDAAILAASQTGDDAEKLAQYAIIQEEIVRDLPYIPLVINATQTFYNAKDFTGWPTEDDLYAFPPSWGSGSAGIVLQHLKPAE